MTKLNLIGVDLAKNVIQISVLSPSNRELRNSALTRRKFAEFLGRQRPSLVAFEACATSHYWARVAQRHGHQVKIIPAKTAKDRWLWAIIERSGKCKAAVALANKNVRTAWAMLTQNTEYQRNPLAA